MTEDKQPQRLGPGIYPDVPMARYIADPAETPSVSKGVISDILNRSPLHAWTYHPRFGGHRGGDSPRTDFGSAVHSLILGGPAVRFVDADNWRTKKAQTARDEIRGDGGIPLLARQAPEVDIIATHARKLLEARAPGGVAESTWIWEEGGELCRARPDWHNDDWIIDVKTGKNADPMSWIRTALFAGGYDVAAAHQLAGAERLLGGKTRGFLWLVVEMEPPYDCKLIGAGPELVELAERKRQKGLAIWSKCRKADVWPGYDSEIAWAEVPNWAAYDFEEREIRIGGAK